MFDASDARLLANVTISISPIGSSSKQRIHTQALKSGFYHVPLVPGKYHIHVLANDAYDESDAREIEVCFLSTSRFTTLLLVSKTMNLNCCFQIHHTQSTELDLYMWRKGSFRLRSRVIAPILALFLLIFVCVGCSFILPDLNFQFYSL